MHHPDCSNQHLQLIYPPAFKKYQCKECDFGTNNWWPAIKHMWRNKPHDVELMKRKK